MGHVRNATGHPLALINDILDLSKIEAGQLQLQLQEFQAAEALSEVLATIAPLAARKHIGIDSSVSEEMTIYGDLIRFKQILFNLLSNAVKFTPRAAPVRSGRRVHGALCAHFRHRYGSGHSDRGPGGGLR